MVVTDHIIDATIAGSAVAAIVFIAKGLMSRNDKLHTQSLDLHKETLKRSDEAVAFAQKSLLVQNSNIERALATLTDAVSAMRTNQQNSACKVEETHIQLTEHMEHIGATQKDCLQLVKESIGLLREIHGATNGKTS